MARTPKTPKHDEEYKFAEEMEHQLETPEKPPRPNLLKVVLSNRKVIVFLGVIFAVLVLYQFIGKTTPIKQEIAEVTNAQPALQPAKLQSTAPTVTTVQPVVVDETQQQIQALVAQGQQNQQQMQQLQTNVQQLQSSVTQLGNQAAVAACPQVVIAKPAPRKIAAPVVKKAQPKVPFYTVRAVVPGRAWLQEKKHDHIVKLLTVRVGDYLPGYGRIQAISPRDGKVWTSWGNVIHYGANDS